MTYAPYPRATLLIPTDPGKHLYIVMTNKCGDACHLLLSVSSIKPNKHHDPTCEFEGGEHEFIKKRSFVYYRKPLRSQASSIIQLVAKRWYLTRNDLDEVHFARVCDGVTRSEFSRPWAVAYFAANRPS
jgi:hypothetical protein